MSHIRNTITLFGGYLKALKMKLLDILSFVYRTDINSQVSMFTRNQIKLFIEKKYTIYFLIGTCFCMYGMNNFKKSIIYNIVSMKKRSHI
jgi:hypothetical protein